ncbi:hypothetical protein BD779DRAFT_1506658 [Infundibulicybe gibba]|nr:hypothetical protein BD779DRAFT_1506658 [Infundibulicybe gibba]
MTSDSPPSNSTRKQSPPSSPKLSPAQAIAEAWKRESVETQQRWRNLDANVRSRYTAPRRKDPKAKM